MGYGADGGGCLPLPSGELNYLQGEYIRQKVKAGRDFFNKHIEGVYVKDGVRYKAVGFETGGSLYLKFRQLNRNGTDFKKWFAKETDRAIWTLARNPETKEYVFVGSKQETPEGFTHLDELLLALPGVAEIPEPSQKSVS